jgi:Carboxypeptidase regulatory-like domain
MGPNQIQIREKNKEEGIIPVRDPNGNLGAETNSIASLRIKEAHEIITTTSNEENSDNRSLAQNAGSSVFGTGNLIWISLSVLLWGVPALGVAQSQVPPPEAKASSSQESPVHQNSGGISGAIVDPSGAAVAGARVKLACEDPSASQEVLSDDDGQFTFANVPPGAFQFTIMAEGFATQAFSGILHPGEDFNAPPIELVLGTKSIDVQVAIPQSEVAEEQIKEEEKQRVLGFIPNFYVTYLPNAAPLTSKQKFKLAWKSMLDPVTFALTGVLAGGQQAHNDPSSYGQGIQGFGKRYGAIYTDLITDTFVGGAILPSLLKQDPRYFYKGTGNAQSRFLYAIANTVICKGDNGHWQANYSSILGSLASGGISNLYYPAQDRSRVELTFRNTGIRIGITAVGNLLQEFLLRKLTRNVSNHKPPGP